MSVRTALHVGALGFASLVLLACTPAARRPSPAAPVRDVEVSKDHPTRAATPSSPGWLVWTHAEDGTLETALVDGSASVVASAPTMVTAIDGELWGLTRARATRELAPCEEGIGGELGPTASESLALVRLGDGAAEAPRRAVLASIFDDVTAKDQRPEIGVVVQTADVIGSVGPYLFARDDRWEFMCGAHGSWYRTAHVVDVRTGAEVKLSLDDADEAERDARARFVEMGEKDESVTTLWSDGAPGPLFHAAVEPRLDTGAGGVIELVHVFLAEACYACGGSSWRSYAVETEVPAATPHHLRESDLTLPPAVFDYVTTHDVVAGFGGFAEVHDVAAAKRAMKDAPRIAPRPKP